MSTRSHIKPFPVVTAASMGASVTSTPTIIENITGVGYDVRWTGTPVGTFSVQISNTYSVDAMGNTKNAGTWTPVTLSSPITAAGSADNAFINLAGVESYAVRLVYTRTSGTGILDAVISGKVQ